MNKVVKKVYMTVGENEILRDQVVAFEALLRRKGFKEEDLTFEKVEAEAHVFIVLEGMTGQVGDATRRMKRWVAGAIRD